MPEADIHQLVTAKRKIQYPDLQALYLDVAKQREDGEEFAIVDAENREVLTGVWHPWTPSRY